MKRALIVAASVALIAPLAAGTQATAQDATVSTVDVNAALEDAANANALQFWPNIDTNLEEVIMSMVGPRVSDDGYQVTVELEEISLSGSNILEGTGEFNQMEGWVYFRSPDDSVPVHQHEIVVNAETLSVGVDETGITVPDVPEFYTGLLTGFAIGVIEQLDRLDPAGDGAQGENRQADEG